MTKQVEINGRASKISKEKSLAYFRSRPRGSQLGAWASEQSSEIESRSSLDKQLVDVEDKYADGDIPLPNWGGYCVVPEKIEFWQGGARRLHDRFEYSYSDDLSWVLKRLQP